MFSSASRAAPVVAGATLRLPATDEEIGVGRRGTLSVNS